jgi:hypothetical protein
MLIGSEIAGHHGMNASAHVDMWLIANLCPTF